MLRGVIDPELHASIVDLGMVDTVTIDDDGRVVVSVALTTAGCPLRGQIKRDVESKVRGLRGVRDVKVEYGEMTPEQKTAAMQRARFNARENAAPTEVASTTRVRAIASGKGGVGKSSVTVNLAVALAARGFGSACSTPTSGASASRGCSGSTAVSAVPRARSRRTS